MGLFLPSLLETLERWAVRLQPPAQRVVPLRRREGPLHVFSIKMPVVLGTRAQIHLRERADKNFSPRVIHTNVPQHSVMLLKSLKISNVGWLLGGTVDAYAFSKKCNRVELDLPTIEWGTSVSVSVLYTGLVPEGMKAGDAFDFEISLEGPEMLLDHNRAEDDHAI